MQIVHYARDLIEAQMLASFLESEGIKAQVNGINLMGGAGELPVNDILNIAVADIEAQRAKVLIADYLSAKLIEPNEDN